MEYMRQHTSHAAPQPVLRPVDATDARPPLTAVKKEARVVVIVYIVLLLLGIGTGYILLQKGTAGSPLAPAGTPITANKVVGVQDASTFKDCASGTVEKDGVEGEGTHKLIRDGGPSQTAYLISSIVDLDQYVGLKVKVCGQTLAAKKVSWLMDVGRLELE